MDVCLCAELGAADLAAWRGALAAALPRVRWLTPEQARETHSSVLAAVVANPAPGQLSGLSRLALVQSLWAGVDKLLTPGMLPAGVPLARMVDPSLSAAMAQTALWAVISLHRGFFTYAQRHRAGQWRQHVQRRADECRVLVLGMGQLGQAAARAMLHMGYAVEGWRLTPALSNGAELPWPVHAGSAALQAVLGRSQVVLNLLPLTPATRGLMDKTFFAAMPQNASVVNLARGAHVVDEDLLAALASGHIRHAVLDVFHTEPLPAGHPYWGHAAVTLLPHVAALTDLRSAAQVVAHNLQALHSGAPLRHLVDLQRGY